MHRLMVSKDPARTLCDESGDFHELIEKLHHFTYIPDDILIPLNAISDSCGIPLRNSTQTMLNKLCEVLIQQISQNPSIIPKVLESMHEYLYRSNFSTIFEQIVLKIGIIPDYFLIQLLELPIGRFTNIFKNNEALQKLFSQCRPLFHHVIINTIEEFCSNPLNIDIMLNTIRIRNFHPRPFDYSFNEKEFSFKINLRSNPNSSLTDHHNSIVRTVAKTLFNYCCKTQVFYTELCTILRDIWEKTGNPLLSSIRLQIGSIVQTIPQISDPIQGFCTSAFSFFDRLSGLKYYPEPDAIFASRDPILQYLLYCKFTANMFDSIEKRDYTPFDNRGEHSTIVGVLIPYISKDEMEDISNNIEAYYISSIMNLENIRSEDAVQIGEKEKGFQRIVKETTQDLYKFANDKDDAAHLIMFVGLQLMICRNKPSLLRTALSVPKLSPNIVLGYLLTRYMTETKLDEQIIEVLSNWSSIDHTIMLYTLAVFENCLDSGIHEDIVLISQFLPNFEQACVDAGSNTTEMQFLKVIQEKLDKKLPPM